MNMQRVLLTLVGAIVSMIVAIILVRYSKKAIAKTMSSRHILHMLRNGNMNSTELTYSAKKCGNDVISPKLVPVLLVKLEEEGLIQRTSNSKYVITTKGLESLWSIDAMSKEFQKVAKIVQKTSTISKFMLNEAIDRVTMIANIDDYGKESIPLYGANK